MSDMDGMDAFNLLLDKVTDSVRAQERSRESLLQVERECRKTQDENRRLSEELAAAEKLLAQCKRQKSYDALRALMKALDALMGAGGFNWREAFPPDLYASVDAALSHDDHIPF